MRSTHDHEDRVRYWLTDAEGGGQPIPDKVFMVMSRDKKEEIWPSPMTKAPIPTEMSKGQSNNTNNATKKFD